MDRVTLEDEKVPDEVRPDRFLIHVWVRTLGLTSFCAFQKNVASSNHNDSATNNSSLNNSAIEYRKDGVNGS